MIPVGLDFRDDRWTQLLGGYRVPYDPRHALLALETGEDTVSHWHELWNELYHQGDIGDASYASVPHLVRIHELRGVPDWNTYALIATIELARDNSHNPEIPSDLRESYDTAWQRIIEIGLRDLRSADEGHLVTSIIGVLAIGKGQRTLGRIALEFTDDECQELLAKSGWITSPK